MAHLMILSRATILRSSKLRRALRTLILDLDADAVEVVRLGDHAASFGLVPKKMSEAYAYIMPKAAYVNLASIQRCGLWILPD